MRRKDGPIILAELLNDPEKLGYAAHIAVGADGPVADLLNDDDEGDKLSRLGVLLAPGATITHADIAQLLAPQRAEDAAAAYMRGEWPAIAVPIPDDVADRYGLTKVHYHAAKLANEGVIDGLAEADIPPALDLLTQLQPAKARAVTSAAALEALRGE